MHFKIIIKKTSLHQLLSLVKKKKLHSYMLWPLQKRSLAEYTGYFLLLKSNFEKLKLFLIITKISFIMHRSENTRSQKQGWIRHVCHHLVFIVFKVTDA